MPVTGLKYAQQAYTYRDSGIPYSQLDCIHFVNQVRIDLGLRSMLNGTNTLWRSNNLVWKGTLQDAYTRWVVSRWNQLPQVILLFRIKSESDPTYNEPPIPSRYYMDGIGNVTHVGIMTGLGQGIMQSGGYGGRGVHESGWQNGYWTHAALPMIRIHHRLRILIHRILMIRIHPALMSLAGMSLRGCTGLNERS